MFSLPLYCYDVLGDNFTPMCRLAICVVKYFSILISGNPVTSLLFVLLLIAEEIFSIMATDIPFPVQSSSEPSVQLQKHDIFKPIS